MNQEQYASHKAFAGEKKPSMLRRRVGHDYQGRRIYLITMTTEGRQPLFGRLVGDGDATPDGADAARVELTPLGQAVKDEWLTIGRSYPEVSVLAIQMMPDHLHGILFVERPMKQHLGMIIRGFKTGTNRHYRRLVLGLPAKGEEAPGTDGETGAADTEAADTEAATKSQHSKPPQPKEAEAQERPTTREAEAQEGRTAGEAEGMKGKAAVGCAATESQHGGQQSQRTGQQGQPKRDRRLDDRQHGLLWSPGYNDHILSGNGELERWCNYLRDNPRRLAIRRAHPDYFRVRFGVTIGSQTYAAIGNRFLLTHPQKRQVQLSRSLTEEQVAAEVEKHLALARQGVILVSPAISEGEQAVMRAVLDAGLPLVFLTPWGFNAFSKPGHQYYEACAAGQLLLLAPWPHQNRRLPLTRQMCLALNAMAREMCGGEAATQSQHSQP